MSNEKLHLKIITPDRVLVDEMVDAIYSKATDGEFGVLPGHINFMTAVDICVTRYIKAGKEEYISTIGGIFQLVNNEIIILSDIAESGSEIDLTRAKASKERAEARLKIAARDVDIHRAQVALARAIARISAASKMHPGI